MQTKHPSAPLLPGAVLATLLVLPLFLTAAAPAWSDEPVAAKPAFTGTWLMDKQASDDLTAVLRAAGAERGPGGRGGPGGRARGRGDMGGMGGPGGAGGMGGSRGGGDSFGAGGGPGDPDEPGAADAAREKMRQRGEALSREFERLEIFHEGDELNITDGLDVTHLFHTDGRKSTVWTPRGEAEVQAAWDGDDLVVDWQGGRGGPGHTRRYSLSDDGDELTVLDVRSQPGKDEKVTIRFVYRRAGAREK